MDVFRRVCALLVVLAVLPAAAEARTPQFGAWTPGDPYAGTTPGADALESATGRRVEIVHWFQNWGGGDWVSAVQPHALRAVAAGERTPMLTWEPWAPAAGTDQPTFSLARIAAGDFDAYIASWAAALKAHGSPVYLRPMHEMNGDWYPWGGTVNGNSPALFVQAWRHIVDTFRLLEASNVRFVWSPNNVDVPAWNVMEAYYPGDAYVDVLATDGYNWGAGTPAFGGWQSFSAVFRSAYDRLRVLGPQPIWIAEVGTSDDGGDKPAWIRDMFARASELDRLEAIVWFNEHKERDWRAAATPEVAAAFLPGTEQLQETTAYAATTTTSLGGVQAAGATTSTGTTSSSSAAADRDGQAIGAAGATTSPDGVHGARGSASDDASGTATQKLRTGPRPRLRLTLGRARVGGRGVVRWRVSRTSTVRRWRVYLNGRLVRDTGARTRAVRTRITRHGSHRWRVVGRDSRGRAVVSASRSFRVRR